MNCVCGDPAHPYDECDCGCTLFELDNGTLTSPTKTGNPLKCTSGVLDYSGKYGNCYGTLGKL